MRLIRPAIAVAAAALLALAGSSHAGSAPATLTFTDAAGDALTQQASHDITRVAFTTTGKTTRVGGRTVYKPHDLVVTMTLAGSPLTVPGMNYEIDADLSGCGTTHFTYTPNAVFKGGLYTACGSPPDSSTGTATLYEAPPTVKGGTLTWVFDMSGLSPEFKAGAVFSSIRAFTVLNDPAVGVIGPGVFGLDFDDASTTKSFKIA